MIISCEARGKGTPSMMAYTGRLRPKSRRSTQQIFVRGGSAPRSNPLPVEKAFYICDWFLFYDSAGLQQLKQIQSYKQGMWKEYPLSIEGTQNCEKWYIKICWVPPPPRPSRAAMSVWRWAHLISVVSRISNLELELKWERGLIRPNPWDRDSKIIALRSCAGPSLMQVQSYRCFATKERFYMRKMFNSHRRIVLGTNMADVIRSCTCENMS